MAPRLSLALSLLALVTAVPAGAQLPGLLCSASGGIGCNASIPPGAPEMTEGTTVSSFLVSDCDVIEDVDVGVALSHTAVRDLRIWLQGPSMVSELLFFGKCGINDDLRVIFDDEGGIFACNDARRTGFVASRPDPGTLGAFDGHDGNGTWTLTVVDDDPAGDVGNTGRLEDWSLDLTCSPATPVPTLPAPGLGLLALLLALAAAVVLARRRVEV